MKKHLPILIVMLLAAGCDQPTSLRPSPPASPPASSAAPTATVAPDVSALEPITVPEAQPAVSERAPRSAATRYGINFYAPKDWNRMQPFLNVMKLSRPWISQSATTWDTELPLELDERGYVTRLAPGQWAATVMLTEVGESFPGGEYIFLYDGEGEFEWKGNARLVSATPGRQVVNVTPRAQDFVHLVMTSVTPGNHPRNMRFVRAAYERTFEQQTFAPEMIKLWGDVDTIRFMDWMLINNSKIVDWEDFHHPDDRTYYQRGVPLPVIARLVNQLKVNAWICVPHLATDATIRKMAEFMRDHVDPGLTVYFEFSNEVWNGMFAQTRFAQARGQELGLDTAGWKAGAIYHARDCRRMFDILDAVYAGQSRERYRKVIATQAANSGFIKIVVDAEDVYRHADVLAIAPYLTFNVPEEPSSWKPDMPVAAEVATWNLDRLFAWLNQHALPECLGWMDTAMKLARERDLDLACYEAGQHLTALGNANRNTTLVDLLHAANRDPRMGDLYTAYLNHWTELGGGVICLFNSDQPYSPAGSWGLLEFIMQDPATSPKYMAVKRWAAGLR